MTANTTEQDRAEVRKAIESALDEVHIEDGTTYWFDRVIEEVTTAVMSTRRATVVPVPQGWKLVPEKGTEAMARAFRADDAPGYFCMTTLRCADFAERYAAMLAAAPQPPEAAQLDDIGVVDMAQAVDSKEAAPVQLPEYGIDTANHAGIRVRGYTEQQVLAILAQHGIKTK